MLMRNGIGKTPPSMASVVQSINLPAANTNKIPVNGILVSKREFDPDQSFELSG